MQNIDSTVELHKLVMGNVAKLGGASERRFANRVVDELNHQLLEAGLVGIQRRFALEKVRHDLEQNYSERAEELQGLTSQDKYALIQPGYMNQLLDPEYSDALVEVWIELMLAGDIEIPKTVPSMLGQWLVRNDREWAEANLEPKDPGRNMLLNKDLLVEVLYRVELM